MITQSSAKAAEKEICDNHKEYELENRVAELQVLTDGVKIKSANADASVFRLFITAYENSIHQNKKTA